MFYQKSFNSKPEMLLWLVSFLLFFIVSSAFAGQPSGETFKPTVQAKEPLHVKGEVLVKFKNSNRQQNISSISAYGVRVVKYYGVVGNIALLKFADERTPVKAMIESLQKNAGHLIEYVEPNFIVQALGVPNDSQFSSLWGMNNTGQTGGTVDADIDAVEAWDVATDASNVVVGVIDTGVDYTHPDLAANIWVNPGEIAGNGIDDDGNGYIDDIHGIDSANNDTDPMDDNDHGTHVSGTIGGAGNNSNGVTGVAWNVKIMALKFLSASGSGSAANAIELINYAVDMKLNRGVNIVLTSNSWGGGSFSQSVKDAIDASSAADMLFIAAAGNSGTDNDVTPSYPASYASSNIIAVASSDHNDTKSGFSQYGATSVDLAAPGSNILSTIAGGGYDTFSGTSMATPHVAGAAALAWANTSSPNAITIKTLLLSTVDQVSAFTGKVQTGGRLNINNALTCDSNTVVLNTSQDNGFNVPSGVQIVLNATLTNCAPATGATVTANFSNGDPAATLLDNGVAPDLLANDGVYSAFWTPVNTGAVTVNYLAVHNGSQYPLQRNGTVTEQVTYQVNDTATFNWIDISGTGTNMNLADDSHFFPIDFDFNYYGRGYTQVAVGSNGGIYFENVYLNLGNASLPTTSTSMSSFIALLWDDLNPSANGSVYYEIQGNLPNRKLIIQYNDVARYGNGVNGATFQVILSESDDSILMQYLDTDFGTSSLNGGKSATVGLQDSTTFAQQYSYNVASLSNNQAILWSRGPALPAITSPVLGATLSGASETFAFDNNGLTIDNWYLRVGTTLGNNDIANRFVSGSATSLTVSGLPIDGSDVYVRLRYKEGGIWKTAADYTYTSFNAYNPEITSPVSGSVLSGSSELFSLDNKGLVLENWNIRVGSTVGNNDIANRFASGSSTSLTVSGLPTDGSLVYVRLKYKLNGTWVFAGDYSYSAHIVPIVPTVPFISSPVAASTLSGPTQMFELDSAGLSFDNWYLRIGSSIGGNDIANRFAAGSATSLTVTDLPVDGSTIYVRLMYKLNGVWTLASDYSYVASFTPVVPEITSPALGDVLSGSTQTFELDNAGIVFDNWYLRVGSSVGGNDIANRFAAGSATSLTISGLPTNGNPIYVRLMYKLNGVWETSNDYNFLAFNTPTNPYISSPVPTSKLSGASETFQLNSNGFTVENWNLRVGSTLGGNDIANRFAAGSSSSIEITGLPSDGSLVFVRLMYKLNGAWAIADDYTYDAYGDLSGFNEQFTLNISNWDQVTGSWTNNQNNSLYTQGVTTTRSVAKYSLVNNYSNIEYSAKVKRVEENEGHSANALQIRSDGVYDSNGHCRNCYFFQYSAFGDFSVWKSVNYEPTPVQTWTPTSAINTGSAWNTLRVIANGNNFAFYINDILIWSGSDSSHGSGAVTMSMYKNEATSSFTADWAILNVLSSTSSISDVVSDEQLLLNASAHSVLDINGVEK